MESHISFISSLEPPKHGRQTREAALWISFLLRKCEPLSSNPQKEPTMQSQIRVLNPRLPTVRWGRT